MTSYTGTNATIETGSGVLRDDTLAQELIKAQAAQRMANSDFQDARVKLRIADDNVREITAEIGRRAWVAAGVVFNETILYVRGREHTKYLATGVDAFRGDLVVRARTAKGNWFKRTNTLYLVKPSDIVIVGKVEK
jgi:hypothetical protein